MKDLSSIRNKMAEKGVEFTPNQFAKIVNELRQCQKSLKKSPDTLGDLSVEEKQDLMRLFRESGKEVSPEELKAIIEIATAIRNMGDI